VLAVSADANPGPGPRAPELPIQEIRDYQKVNAELIQRLDAGHSHVRLIGAEGQRLLVAGLAGAWNALVEVVGHAGPELAAGLNAPGLTVVCHGPAADGAGGSLLAGRLVVEGEAGPAVGYAQRGGTIIVIGDAGPRAGPNQSGGLLFLCGDVGPLAAERQSGGLIVAFAGSLGPHSGRGRRGGRLLTIPDADAEPTLRLLWKEHEPWLPVFEERIGRLDHPGQVNPAS
jgi:methylamine---glutamate N-methyltransferase subunit B